MHDYSMSASSAARLQSAAKEVIEKGDDQYLDFHRDQAVQTYDVLGKHIYEFKRKSDDDIPEIFVLLVAYFEA